MTFEEAIVAAVEDTDEIRQYFEEYKAMAMESKAYEQFSDNALANLIAKSDLSVLHSMFILGMTTCTLMEKKCKINESS